MTGDYMWVKSGSDNWQQCDETTEWHEEGLNKAIMGE